MSTMETVDEISIKVHLTNFDNRIIYEGKDLYAATFAAKTSGFECSMILTRGKQTAIYGLSPISGWKVQHGRNHD